MTKKIETGRGERSDGVIVGSRVVLRYKLPPGYSHPLTDVIGELISLDPVSVRAASGEVVSVVADDVVVLKALGPRPIRTSEIRALEQAAADGWPGVEQEWLDGWFLRAGHGFTHRANSAVPLGVFGTGVDASLEALPAVLQWFSDRGMPPILLIPDRLGAVPPGWKSWGDDIVMAADIANLVLPPGRPLLAVEPEPSQQWWSLFQTHRRDVPFEVADVVGAVRDGEVGFGSLGSPPLAIARAAVTTAPDDRRWVGLFAVGVGEEHRRRGLGTLVCAAMISWGADRGATHAYVQVEANNAAAVAMYRELGFVEHHRYRYASP